MVTGRSSPIGMHLKMAADPSGEDMMDRHAWMPVDTLEDCLCRVDECERQQINIFHKI